MTVKFKNKGNAAFTEYHTGNPCARFDESARILREIADSIEQGNTSGTCRDINGNSVGKWSID